MGTSSAIKTLFLAGGVNHITERFRLVTVLIKGRKLLRLVTNRFDVSPNEVMDMYQAYWQNRTFLQAFKAKPIDQTVLFPKRTRCHQSSNPLRQHSTFWKFLEQ